MCQMGCGRWRKHCSCMSSCPQNAVCAKMDAAHTPPRAAQQFGHQCSASRWIPPSCGCTTCANCVWRARDREIAAGMHTCEEGDWRAHIIPLRRVDRCEHTSTGMRPPSQKRANAPLAVPSRMVTAPHRCIPLHHRDQSQTTIAISEPAVESDSDDGTWRRRGKLVGGHTHTHEAKLTHACA
jgi:hypothetical protein